MHCVHVMCDVMWKVDRQIKITDIRWRQDGRTMLSSDELSRNPRPFITEVLYIPPLFDSLIVKRGLGLSATLSVNKFVNKTAIIAHKREWCHRAEHENQFLCI